jgi:hypothetical protein
MAVPFEALHGGVEPPHFLGTRKVKRAPRSLAGGEVACQLQRFNFYVSRVSTASMSLILNEVFRKIISADRLKINHGARAAAKMRRRQGSRRAIRRPAVKPDADPRFKRPSCASCPCRA